MNSTHQPGLLLSVVIPVYNRQVGLNSLLSDLSKAVVVGGYQTIMEVIVVDDASPCSILVPEFPCSMVSRRNQENRGAPYSRKVGFKLSKGRFVHFHDSDDTITESWLSQVVSKLQKAPDLDLLMTARIDRDKKGDSYRSQKYFHKQVLCPDKIQSRLIYRNCMGPLGGVTFSRRVLEGIEFKPFASCQDWQMYLEVIQRSKVLMSCPDIQFVFNKTGDDRISHNSEKKILGHLQLSKITSKDSIFKRNIRLFYLYTCKTHIMNKKGKILNFYQKNRLSIYSCFFVISLYWRFRL